MGSLRQRNRKTIHSQCSHLREGDTYDLVQGISDTPYKPLDIREQESYISETLSKLKYPYESDKPVEYSQLKRKVDTALLALRGRAQRLNLNVKSKIDIFADGNCFAIHSGDPEFGVNLSFTLMRITKQNT